MKSLIINMTVISLSLSPELLDQLDKLVKSSGYSSRSEAIRMAVRETLSQFALQHHEQGKVMATVTIIYETELREVNSKLTDYRHGLNDAIFGNMHLHIGGSYCVEIFLVQGDAATVLSFISNVRAIKGISEVKYTMTPIGNAL